MKNSHKKYQSTKSVKSDESIETTFPPIAESLGSTKRAKTEELLSIEKRFSDATINSLPGVFYMADKAGNFLRWNNTFSEVTGYTDAEISRMHPKDFFEGEDRKRIKNKAIEVFEEGQASTEASLVTKDGKKIPYFLTGKRVFFNKTPYLIGSGIDISIVKKAERKLQKSDERYDAFIHNSSEGIWCFKMEKPFSVNLPTEEQIEQIYHQGVLVECNDAMGQMYGFEKAEEVLGNKIKDYLDLSENQEYFRRFVESGYKLSDVESHEKDKDGNDVYFLNNLNGIVEDGYFVRAWGTQRDVTALKQAEKAYVELEKQLHQSQKIEPLGRLAGGIAHDFNNFLAVIMLHTDMLSRELPEDSVLGFRVDEIKTVSEKAANMVRQLLAFGRKQTLQPQPTNLNQVVEEFIKAIGTIIGEDIEIELDLENALGVCIVDPGQMTQVLMNLAVNARDAMTDGGVLKIGTANLEIDENTFKHKAQPKGSYVQLSVADNGIGMDAKTKKHVFEPFFTTKEASKGTGLGLATVYGIIKQSKGFIWVDSKPGKGTTFKIQFPRSDKSAKLVKQDKPTKMMRGTETILLVEDEEPIRKAAVEILKALGYNILEAKDVNDAIEIAKSYEKNIQLLVTDVVMPKMNGRELARKVKKLHPEASVLFISGYTDDIISRHGILEEDVYFLGKPFSPSALAQKVRQSLEE